MGREINKSNNKIRRPRPTTGRGDSSNDDTTTTTTSSRSTRSKKRLFVTTTRNPKIRSNNNNVNANANTTTTTTTTTTTRGGSCSSRSYLICCIILTMNIIWQLQTNIWNSIISSSEESTFSSETSTSTLSSSLLFGGDDYQQQQAAILPVHLLSSISAISSSISLNETTTTITITNKENNNNNNHPHPTKNQKNIIIDIMSIASKDRKEYLIAQKETFGKHINIRNFWNVTEDDDFPSWFQNCSISMTKDDAMEYINTCRKRHSKTNFLKQYKFFHPRWYMRKPNPIGWLCAQVRPGSGIGKLGQYYNNNHNNNNLPDYLWLIDDDTLIRIDMFIEQIMKSFNTNNPSVPKIYAGCLTVLDHEADKNHQYKRYSPFGGAGTVWSRGAIQRLMQPIHCSNNNNNNNTPTNPKAKTDKDDEASTSSSSLFVKQVCNRIDENLILERDLFQDGMKLYEFIQTVFHYYPNCFHSDWLLGHFIDYYYLSEPIIQQQLEKQQNNNNNIQRLHPLTNESLQLFYNDTAPIGDLCIQTSIKKQTRETCSKDHMVCHYVTPEKMEQFY